jgi:hypothetical protein
MALGMRRFALCSAKRAALYSAGLKLLCKPKTELMTSKVAKYAIGDEGEKRHIGNCRLLMKPIAD